MKTKECTRCGEVKPLTEFRERYDMKDGHLNQCRACCNKDTIRWGKENPELRRQGLERYKQKYPIKDKACKALNNKVRDGKIIKPKQCSFCHSEEFQIHGHHEDYSKPFDVIWLCRPCHGKLHHERRTREAQH